MGSKILVGWSRMVLHLPSLGHKLSSLTHTFRRLKHTVIRGRYDGVPWLCFRQIRSITVRSEGTILGCSCSCLVPSHTGDRSLLARFALPG
jgi:hypothetical protein